MPICFHGQNAVLTDVDDTFLHLDRPVVCKHDHELVVVQPRFEASPQGMQKLVCDAWNQYWQAPDHVSDDAAEFIQNLGECPTCPFQEFELEKWRRCAKGVKLKSARGACGFSMRDMQTMPDSLVAWLFQMYNAIEAGMKWPRRLTLARVAMLAKPGEDNHKPLAVRPITIGSVLYRMWSRYRSLQVIQHLGASVPAQIGGIAARLSADCLTAYVCDMLEDSHSSRNHRVGLVLDLQKCFNLIPRSTLAKLMEKLQLPCQYIKAHQSMLGGLRRLVEIAGQVGSEQDSSCGVPEGCAFSVVSMVVMTILAAEVMGYRLAGVEVAMFADNWSVTTTSVPLLCEVICRLEKLVESLGMRISAEKSWLWGTCPKLRKELKKVKLAGKSVQVQLSAKDLGCDVSYSKKKCKKVTKKRFCKAISTLQKVKARRLPKAFKGKMCATLGAGIAGYGSEFHKHTSQEMHRLRSATAEALGLYRSGANAWLAVNATGLFRDPQLQLLKRKIKFFRRFLRLFPERRAKFLDWLMNRSWGSGAGITKQLAEAFNEVGWNWVDIETMEHDSGLRIKWLTDSVTLVMKVLEQAWLEHVAAQVHRPNFDIDSFDAKAFARCVKKRSPRQQGILLTLACGKHVTMDALVHYAEKVPSKKCPFCEVDDSKEHRMFYCPGLADVRKKYAKVVKWMETQQRATWAFAHFPVVGKPLEHKRRLQVERQMTLPPLVERVMHVYTDGSAFFGESWDCCLAGSAVVQWCPNERKMCKVVRSILPFQEHSSYRAEVFAVVLALERFWRVDIFSDCEAVVLQFGQICDALERGGKVTLGSHADLWMQIVEHLKCRPRQYVRLFKVKAHVQMKDALTDIDKLHAWGNGYVDECAKKAITVDHAALKKKMEEIMKERAIVFSMMDEYFDMVCDISDRYFQVRPAKVEQSCCPDFAMYAQVTGPTFRMPCMTVERMNACPYTPAFAKKFQSWIKNVVWGEGQPISGLEMYFAFAMETGFMVPVQIKEKQYALRSESITADQFKLDLSRQSRVWINFLVWWLDGIDSPIQLTNVKAAQTIGLLH